MTIYEVDKNIPIPKAKAGNIKKEGTRAGTKFSRTMNYLDVDESFLIEDKSMKDIHSTFSRLSKEGKKFTARTVIGGIRIWRTK